MSCIILKSPLGERKIPENEPYQFLKDEVIVGVDWSCKGLEQRDVESELASRGVKWGDAIAWVTKKLGVKQCAPCKARQEILNHAKENGWVETMRQMKGTL
jgi:transposase-like protein